MNNTLVLKGRKLMLLTGFLLKTSNFFIGTCVLGVLFAPALYAEKTLAISASEKVALTYAEAYKELNQNDKAVEVIKKQLGKNNKSSKLWGYLGLNYLQQEQYQMASEAFGQAVLVASAEDVGVLQYQRANAEVKAGQLANAKKYLQLAAKDPLIEDSALSAMTQMRSGTALPAIVPSTPGRWTGSASIKGGYDDNVLLFSESTLATAARTNTASTVISPTAEVVYEKNTNLGLLNASFNLSGQIYGNTNAKIYESFSALFNTLFSRSKPEWIGLTHSFGNTIKTSYLDSNSFSQQSWDDTLQWRGTKQLSSSQNLNFGQAIRYQFYNQSAGAQSADDRTGVAVKPEVSWVNQVNTYTYSAGLSYEHLFAKGDNYKSTAVAVPLGVQKSFTDRRKGLLGLTYAYTQYPNSTPNRKDGTISANASLLQSFSKTFSGAIEYGYTKNASSLNSASYSRQTIELKVISEIQ